MKPDITTYRGKIAQTSREALISVGALGLTIIVWLVFGFGLSGFDIEIFHVPLWVVMGCVGTWCFSVALCFALGFKVFKNFDLEPIAEETTASSAIGLGAADSEPLDLKGTRDDGERGIIDG